MSARAWILIGVAVVVLFAVLAVGQAMDDTWANTAFPQPIQVRIKKAYGGDEKTAITLNKNGDLRIHPKCTWVGEPDCPTPVPTATPVTPSPTPQDWAQKTATAIANDNMVKIAQARAAATQTVENAKLFPSPTPSPKPTDTPVPTQVPAVKTAIAAQTLSALGALSTKPSPTANATVETKKGEIFATATIEAAVKLVSTPEPGTTERTIQDTANSWKSIQGSMGTLINFVIGIVITIIVIYLIFGKGGLKAIGTLSEAITKLFTHSIGKFVVAVLILLGIAFWLMSQFQ